MDALLSVMALSTGVAIGAGWGCGFSYAADPRLDHFDSRYPACTVFVYPRKYNKRSTVRLASR
jgi:hypothetical protein